MTLVIWPNPVCPPIDTYPLSWAAFYLKHTAPLALTIFMTKQGHLLNKNAVLTALKFMMFYAGFIYIYNNIFDQNILDFRYPTLDFERLFGEWPGFVLANLFITLIWYYLIHVVSIRFNLVNRS
ncbi:MAG: hypothetical protein ACE5D0_02440 [Fidelibacterota bacterium]